MSGMRYGIDLQKFKKKKKKESQIKKIMIWIGQKKI